MTRRRRPTGSADRPAPAQTPAPARGGRGDAPPLSRGRYALLLTITLLVPVLLLGAVEGALRLLRPGGGMPLFVESPFGDGAYQMANPGVATRYFPAEEFPPAPPREPFAVERPARGLRVFVLGESSTAGFPFPRNGAFSRVLRDALHDALPDDSVEVVNLGIAATNSYTLVDLIDEVLAQRPDLVLVYAGHNEYYGALGVGSTQGGGAWPALKRTYLRLLRLRTVQLLRDGVVAVRRAAADDAPMDGSAATMMEVLARDQQIELDGETYRQGLRQFEENLAALIARCRAAGVPVLVGSLASNVRDQPPLVSDGNGAAGGADSTYALAVRTLAAGDSARARELFVRARDLDVVRFRAPSELNDVVRRVTALPGATYVPVAEAFDAASGGMPGRALFLEHVHPTIEGQVLIARTFLPAVLATGGLAERAQPARLRSWDDYRARMALSPFDLRVTHHTLQTLATRWPFVPVEQQQDYRGRYRPAGLADSLAFLVSRGGMPWELAKLQVAADYEARGAPDSSVVELQGLVREAPFTDEPLRLLAAALLAAERPAAAESALVRAHAITPSVYSSFHLGRLALQRRDVPRAIAMLEQTMRLEPGNRLALYSLSLAHGMARDLPAARATAERLNAIDPAFPGLADWRRSLGLVP